MSERVKTVAERILSGVPAAVAAREAGITAETASTYVWNYVAQLPGVSLKDMIVDFRELGQGKVRVARKHAAKARGLPT